MSNQTKSITIQWIVPTIILMMVLMIMLFNFSTKSELNAKNTVTKSMTSTAQICARNLQEQITQLEKVGGPIAEILENEETLDSEYAVKLAEVAMKYSGAYMVYICDETGSGINKKGEEISIADRDYYDVVSQTTSTEYIYTMDDGELGINAIIMTVPIVRESGTGHLLLFYMLNNIETAVKQADFTAWTIETLIDEDGNIMATFGSANQWEKGGNIFEELQKDNATAVRQMKSRMGGKTSGMSSVEMNGDKNALIYVPVGLEDWTLVVGIDQIYIDRQVSQQWKNFKDMMYQLVVVIAVFVFIIVAVNIASKIYNSRRRKQLEEKADTDLLTGLNNKLATERKIKEFIAHNPNARSMMFILDIDNFKKINDTMGHAFGDEVLRSLGNQIGVIFRATDIIGRAGGDEFIIFLKNIADPAIIRKEARKVENFFKDFKAGEYTKYSATASIGVAIYPDEGTDFEAIYKAADQALYKAKKRGKNQLAFYKDEWAEEQQ